MAKLEGKVAVVTSGNSGIGLKTARELKDEPTLTLKRGRTNPGS
jgi:NAD(P)-dependent dehydrogenase (short-subunit alcohol dehydrogenase family)